MAYDEDLAQRVREQLALEDAVTEKGMFGGLAFLVRGNMAVAASGRGGLLVRVDPAATDALVAQPHVDRMQMGGRAMDGWVTVAGDALESEEELAGWVSRGLEYVATLPPKG